MSKEIYVVEISGDTLTVSSTVQDALNRDYLASTPSTDTSPDGILAAMEAAKVAAEALRDGERAQEVLQGE